MKSKTVSGQFRVIRKDTKVATIEKRYGVYLGVRSDMKLGHYLEQKGYPSLSSMLRDTK